MAGRTVVDLVAGGGSIESERPTPTLARWVWASVAVAAAAAAGAGAWMAAAAATCSTSMYISELRVFYSWYKKMRITFSTRLHGWLAITALVV
jgi:hypothetical protein